jgi:hypothetical protein
MDEPNKLDCYIAKAGSDCQEKNALAYWTHLQVGKKWMCYEYGSKSCIHIILFST